MGSQALKTIRILAIDDMFDSTAAGFLYRFEFAFFVESRRVTIR